LSGFPHTARQSLSPFVVMIKNQEADSILSGIVIVNKDLMRIVLNDLESTEMHTHLVSSLCQPSHHHLIYNWRKNSFS
jgi:hypothetical protein